MQTVSGANSHGEACLAIPRMLFPAWLWDLRRLGTDCQDPVDRLSWEVTRRDSVSTLNIG